MIVARFERAEGGHDDAIALRDWLNGWHSPLRANVFYRDGAAEVMVYGRIGKKLLDAALAVGQFAESRAVSTTRVRRDCPKCGEPGEMFTADLDHCPACGHQWPGTQESPC